MRKEQRTPNERRQAANLQGYHQRGGLGINYAFCGFASNKYFTSDRWVACNENFQRLDGKTLKGYGLEIETGFSLSRGDSTSHNVLANILQTAIFSVFPADLFKQQMDSTITGNECITQVMTKEFIRNNYKNFKTMYNDLFPMFGITCDDGKCGMHVNVSNGCFGSSTKTQELAIRKLFYIINRHYSLFKAAFYRKGSTNWCGQMNYRNAKTMDIHTMSGSHNNCFNGSHYDEGRIEIRLVGGQKNYACFRNTMETVFHVVDAVKSLSWEQCDDVVAIFSGCNQYVFNRLETYVADNGAISQAQLDAIRPTIKRVELL